MSCDGPSQDMGDDFQSLRMILSSLLRELNALKDAMDSSTTSRLHVRSEISSLKERVSQAEERVSLFQESQRQDIEIARSLIMLAV